MIKRFKSFCFANQLFSPRDLIFVALSGGMDSMALLHAFLQIKEEFKLDVRAVHINHGLRGAEADSDERFVRQQCEKLGVPLVVRRLQLQNKRDEQALRQARYAAFEQVLTLFPQAKMATGHTLNDNVETVLMRLARGSSLKGLSGIPLKRGPYIRPFLFLERKAIRQFVEQNRIPFVEDATNRDLQYTRNQIRHRLLPVFTEIFGPQVWQNIARSIQNCNAYYHLFEEESRSKFGQLVQSEGETLSVETKKFLALHPLYARQILSYCISNYYALNYSITDSQWGEISKFVQTARTGARLALKKDLILVKERERIRFVREPDETNTVLRLDKNSRVELGNWQIEIVETEKDKIAFTQNPDIEFICGDRLTFPLLVRNWKAGDRFYPLGLGKSQKLKAFFVNRKIERLQKRLIPILLNGNEIVWICGYRLDQRYRITDDCKTVFKVQIKRKKEAENEESI